MKKMRVSYSLLLPLLILLMACSNRQDTPEGQSLFVLQENTGIQFTNSISNTKEFNIFSYRNFYNGGGAGIGDINNDGLADVFFTANMGANKLYLNKGNWQFEDISDKAGIGNAGEWNTGVVFADINADGWLDIFVCNAGYQNRKTPQCKLYINNKDLTFTESAEQYGLTNTGGYTTHAAFFDYDIDGDLDCFIINNSFIPVNTLNYANRRQLRAKDWPVADFLKGGGDKLLRNDNGRFTDVSATAGIYGSLISFGLGVTVGDVNGDSYPDVYVSNDFFEKDYLYINQRNGTFRESLEDWVQHTSLSSMGADLADINNDGYPDLFVTDMLPDDDYRLKTTSSYETWDVFKLKQKLGFYNQFMQNSLQVNTRNGKFVETAYYSGVAASDWSWGGLIFDADNDGLSDLFVCNGIYQDVTDQDFIDFFANDIIQRMVMTGEKEEMEEVLKKMPSNPIPNKAFRNKGNLRFEDVGAQWGFSLPTFSNGAAYGDLDNDGDLDLVVNNLNMPSSVYRNTVQEQSQPHYLALQLKGTGANTFAIGSTVRLYQGSNIITRELMPSRGFQSSCDYKMTIGLGKQPADSLHIIWPNQRITRILQPAKDTLLVLQQPADGPIYTPATPIQNTLLTAAPNAVFDQHQEDDFNDFYVERNMPYMISREGPKAAAADVNGDGWDDVYIGGAKDQPGQLYLGTGTGFRKAQVPAFEADKAFEDAATLFFDADGDADADLLVASGGNHLAAGAPNMQCRLYINDGKGRFTKSPQPLPPHEGNANLALAHDWDADGDADLLVTGRCVPRQYGLPASQYLWRNDGGGRFTDVTASLAPAFTNFGMVTGATWANLDGSGSPYLVMVGEWMAPRLFQYKEGRFQETQHALADRSGWWQSVAAGDLDGDGKDDLILGNLGENFHLQPRPNAPVKLWINDFDNNGIADKIYTKTVQGKDKPVFLKRELTDQVPSLKKQNLRHQEFATRSVQELVPLSTMSGTITLTVNTAASIVAYSNGKGQFEVQELPVFAQLSNLCAIALGDINADGRTDVLMGGNHFSMLPQFSRLDASYGVVLLNRGRRRLEWMEPAASGLSIRGEIRDIQPLRLQTGTGWLYCINNEKPVLMLSRQAATTATK